MSDYERMWELLSNSDEVNDLIVYSDDELEWFYHEKFPKEWALSHEPTTGPDQCKNCASYGCIDNAFIGYCANCAIYVYKGSRGRGFIDKGKENESDIAMQFPSAFDTYLRDVIIESQSS